MHVLTWLACAAGCAALWILQELVGSMLFEGLWELLKWLGSRIFSPFGRPLSRRVLGPGGVAWLRGLTIGGFLGLCGGGWLVFVGANGRSAAECVFGAAAVGVSIVMLLWLDSAQDVAAARRRRAM
jgi:hypothetical protein